MNLKLIFFQNFQDFATLNYLTPKISTGYKLFYKDVEIGLLENFSTTFYNFL